MRRCDHLNLDRIDQDIRINDLREVAQEAAGGEMQVYESPDTPPEIAEQFWQNVLQYEQAEETRTAFPSPRRSAASTTSSIYSSRFNSR